LDVGALFGALVENPKSNPPALQVAETVALLVWMEVEKALHGGSIVAPARAFLDHLTWMQEKNIALLCCCQQ
jgi:hypothetical protein